MSDPDKRRDYDSSDAPQDEPFPTEKDVQNASEAEFYKMCGDVFRKQGRWSKETDIPVLGDEKHTLKKVKEFYKWWLQSYESWRTWKHEDEYDVTEAENRAERRWMERQNEKLQRSFKQKEKSDFVEFVTLAQKYDPRLRREKEEKQKKKDSRAKLKQEEMEKKEKAKQEEVEEQERLKKEQEDAEAAEREAAKKNREREKRRKKEAVKALRTLAKQFYDDNEDNVCNAVNTEVLISNLSVEEMRGVCNAMKEKGKDGIETHYKVCIDEIAERKKGNTPKKQTHEQQQQQS